MDITVHDRAAYARYRDTIAPVIAAHGAGISCAPAPRASRRRRRGVPPARRALAPDRLIVVEFPSRAAFEGFVASPATPAAAPLRAASATTRARAECSTAATTYYPPTSMPLPALSESRPLRLRPSCDYSRGIQLGLLITAFPAYLRARRLARCHRRVDQRARAAVDVQAALRPAHRALHVPCHGPAPTLDARRHAAARSATPHWRSCRTRSASSASYGDHVAEPAARAPGHRHRRAHHRHHPARRAGQANGLMWALRCSHRRAAAVGPAVRAVGVPAHARPRQRGDARVRPHSPARARTPASGGSRDAARRRPRPRRSNSTAQPHRRSLQRVMWLPATLLTALVGFGSTSRGPFRRLRPVFTVQHLGWTDTAFSNHHAKLAGRRRDGCGGCSSGARRTRTIPAARSPPPRGVAMARGGFCPRRSSPRRISCSTSWPDARRDRVLRDGHGAAAGSACGRAVLALHGPRQRRVHRRLGPHGSLVGVTTDTQALFVMALVPVAVALSAARKRGRACCPRRGLQRRALPLPGCPRG